MAADQVLELTDDNFQSQVLEADQPVLVDFWAEWCMPCRALAPTIDEIASEFDGRARVGKLNIDQHQKVPFEYKISAIPTVLVFKNGEVVSKFVGPQSKADLADAINAAGAASAGA